MAEGIGQIYYFNRLRGNGFACFLFLVDVSVEIQL